MGMQGGNSLNLDSGNFRMALYTTAVSASIVDTALSLYSGLGTTNQVAQSGGYVTGGKSLAGIDWTLSGNNYKFTYTADGVVWTGTMTNVRYALIYLSLSVGGGPVVCYCALSTTQFTVASGNTLTVKPNAAGVFTLA